jgi:hypothetical protein
MFTIPYFSSDAANVGAVFSGSAWISTFGQPAFDAINIFFIFIFSYFFTGIVTAVASAFSPATTFDGST